jgi:hypothetical protein
MNVSVDEIECLDWSRELPRPLSIPGVMQLKTLGDVDALVRYLPAERRRRSSWRYVEAEIIEAARGGDVADASDVLRMVLMFEGVVWNE